MAEPKTAIERDLAQAQWFEHFALGEQLEAGVENRDKLGNCLPSLAGSTTLCWLAAEICR
jgi:hypothetical protein